MNKLPGLALAAGAAGLAYAVAGWLPQIKVGAVVWAIVLGVLAGNAMRPGERFSPGLKFCEKKVLEFAVVLLGAGLSLSSLGGFNAGAGMAILAAMAATLAMGPLAARAVKTAPTTGFLLGVGTAICGSAAIAAVSPFVAKDRHETALSIGIVNLAGFAAMLVLPFAARFLHLGLEGSALLLGGALPAVGHAVGAGYAAGPEIGGLAIAVKMGRVLCLVPLVLACSLWAPREAGKNSIWQVVPWFVPVFLLAVGLRSADLIPPGMRHAISISGKAALTAAMAAIGFGVDLEAVRRHGPKALALGAALLLFQVLAVGAAALLLS